MADDLQKITYFAQSDHRGKKTPFGIKAVDRMKHIYVIGKTGMGKSTMLENMAAQDILNGNGMAFIDPHGSTVEELLDYVPEDRIKDVIYFAPFDIEHPISFNIMEDVGFDKRHLVVSGLLSAFKKIWVDTWSARMEYILQNTLLALLEYPDSTILGVNRMLIDKGYRKLVVDNITDPVVKSFWVEEFAKYTDRYTQEATPAIQNKVGQFVSNPLIRNIIGQPKSSFDFRKAMDEKKILIMNLSKGRVGDTNAQLIGSMLIIKIYLAAMSRADTTAMEMAELPPFYFFVDEFQAFANETFANILSESRKYKLSLTIAHQYIEQMPEEVRDAVFGNIGTMVTFRVGAFDAEVLEKELSPTFVMEDLVNLGFTQIYLKLMIDGLASKPFSATTLPPIKKQAVSYKDQIIENSRKTYAKPRALVEEAVKKWHEPIIIPDEKKERREPREGRFAEGEYPRRESRPFPSEREMRPGPPPQSFSNPPQQPPYQAPSRDALPGRVYPQAGGGHAGADTRRDYPKKEFPSGERRPEPERREYPARSEPPRETRREEPVGREPQRVREQPHQPFKKAFDKERPSAISHQSSVNSHQPQATSHRPPATSHQPLATGHRPSVTSHQSSVISHQPSAISQQAVPLSHLIKDKKDASPDSSNKQGLKAALAEVLKSKEPQAATPKPREIEKKNEDEVSKHHVPKNSESGEKEAKKIPEIPEDELRAMLKVDEK